MSDRNLTLVVAMTPTGVIGLDGDMPWRLSSDLRRFKKLTMGGTLLMGRRTYDSIGRPLPGRKTIVITRNPEWSTVLSAEDGELVQQASSPEQALTLLAAHQTTGGFVVGGAQIYDLLLPHCSDLYLTRVWSEVVGDTKLTIDLSLFQVIEQTRLPASTRDDVPSEFLKLKRVNS